MKVTPFRAGLVITGGGAKLANIVNYVKEVSGYNVRTGKPRRKFSAEGIPGIFEPSATTSVGMILAAKEDGLLGCIDPVERPAAFVSAFPNFWPADPVPEETVEDRPMAEEVTEPETVSPEIPEDAEEGVGAELFSNEEVPETKPDKKPRAPKEPKKPKGPKKPGALTITWKKLMGFVDEMTNDMDNEEV